MLGAFTIGNLSGELTDDDPPPPAPGAAGGELGKNFSKGIASVGICLVDAATGGPAVEAIPEMLVITSSSWRTIPASMKVVKTQSLRHLGRHGSFTRHRGPILAFRAKHSKAPRGSCSKARAKMPKSVPKRLKDSFPSLSCSPARTIAACGGCSRPQHGWQSFEA